jgi:hypothetical protein
MEDVDLEAAAATADVDRAAASKCHMKFVQVRFKEEHPTQYYLAAEGATGCPNVEGGRFKWRRPCEPKFETFLSGLHCVAAPKFYENVVEVSIQVHDEMTIWITKNTVSFGESLLFLKNEHGWIFENGREHAVKTAFLDLGLKWYRQEDLEMSGDASISWSPSRGVVSEASFERWGKVQKYGKLALGLGAAAYAAHRAGAFTKVQRYVARRGGGGRH